MPAISAVAGVDLTLPPQSNHQSECLLHGLLLGCVSGGLLRFSHEDIVDFDIRAHRHTSVVECIVCIKERLYTFGRSRRPEARATVRFPAQPISVRRSASVPVESTSWRGAGPNVEPLYRLALLSPPSGSEFLMPNTDEKASPSSCSRPAFWAKSKAKSSQRPFSCGSLQYLASDIDT
jgi:hypothetical protein